MYQNGYSITIATTIMTAKTTVAVTRRRNRADCHRLAGASGARGVVSAGGDAAPGGALEGARPGGDAGAGADSVAIATSPPRPRA